MAEMDVDLTWYMDLFAMVFTLMVGVIILILRWKSEKYPMTLSQRWALSIVGMLYIVNSIIIGMYSFTRSHNPSNMPDMREFISEFNGTLNTLTFLFLLLFGLVFPRPVMEWGRFRKLFIFLGIVWLFLLWEQNERLNGYGPIPGIPIHGYIYYISTFIPIFLWLPEYDRQTSPQMRMTLTILIWGYLFYNFALNGSYFLYKAPVGRVSVEEIVGFTLVIIVLILLLRAVYHRRGNWSTAERLNLLLVGICMVLMILASRVIEMEDAEGTGFTYKSPVLAFIFYMATIGGWTIIRPLLFAYGLLRYQFFGPDVRADTLFLRFGGILGSTAAFLLVLSATIHLTDWSVGIALGIGIICYIPSVRLTRYAVSRLLPVTTSRGLSLSERRAIYLMGLQTAVIHGEIAEKFDEGALEILRRALRISGREHRILMAGFAKEKPLLAKEEIEEAYLFHKDGTLLGHVASKEVEAEEKGAMMASMFTAVRDFAKDALRTGDEHVDSIEYGYSTLIVEIEGDIGLGLLLRGRDNPNVRQRMREILDSANKRFGKKVASMLKEGIHEREAVRAHLEGLEGLLRDLLEE